MAVFILWHLVHVFFPTVLEKHLKNAIHWACGVLIKKKNTTDSKNRIQKKSMYVYSMLFVIFLDIQYTCAITLLKKKI